MFPHHVKVYPENFSRFGYLFKYVDVRFFVKIEKIIEILSVLRYLFLKGNTPTQIINNLGIVYCESTPSFTQEKIWASKFKSSRTTLRDDEPSRRPQTATIDDNIAQAQQMMLYNHRIKVREIERGYENVERTCLSYFESRLGRRKPSRWVPRLFMLDHKRVRMNICRALLMAFRRTKGEFWCLLIAVDHSWIHPYTPETKLHTAKTICYDRESASIKQTFFRLGK